MAIAVIIILSSAMVWICAYIPWLVLWHAACLGVCRSYLASWTLTLSDIGELVNGGNACCGGGSRATLSRCGTFPFGGMERFHGHYIGVPKTSLADILISYGVVG